MCTDIVCFMDVVSLFLEGNRPFTTFSDAGSCASEPGLFVIVVALRIRFICVLRHTSIGHANALFLICAQPLLVSWTLFNHLLQKGKPFTTFCAAGNCASEPGQFLICAQPLFVSWILLNNLLKVASPSQHSPPSGVAQVNQACFSYVHSHCLFHGYCSIIG